MSRTDILEVYAGSVSGGGFPAQIQEIIYVTEAKKEAFNDETTNMHTYYTPDLCMGTSGGNVALYVAISGNWEPGSIHRVIKQMNAGMFSQTWWPGPMSFIPTWVLGIFEGAVYKPGYGAKQLLDAFNNKNSIVATEMWNSSFNKDQQRTAIFCNKSDSDTFISPFTYSSFNSKTLPLNFLNGDIGKISTTVIASASVPLLFKPVVIDSENYIDGGVTYASPLSILSEEIYKSVKGIVEPLEYEVQMSVYPIPEPTVEQKDKLILKRSRRILHLTYFSPYNIDSTSKSESVLGGGNFLSFVTDSSAVKDRESGLELLNRLKTPSQNINVIDSRTSMFKLSDLFKQYNSTHYLCEVYVRENNWIDLNNFTPNDIFAKMEEAKANIEFLFFYVT